MNKFIAGVVICGASLLGVGSVAFAGGPPEDVLDGNNNTWVCGDEGGLPAYHCLNIRSNGNTGLIIVLDGDARWPAEGISFDPKSDDRPCPNDPAATDGTWWSPFEGAWVCHRKP